MLVCTIESPSYIEVHLNGVGDLLQRFLTRENILAHILQLHATLLQFGTALHHVLQQLLRRQL